MRPYMKYEEDKGEEKEDRAEDRKRSTKQDRKDGLGLMRRGGKSEQTEMNTYFWIHNLEKTLLKVSNDKIVYHEMRELDTLKLPPFIISADIDALSRNMKEFLVKRPLRERETMWRSSPAKKKRLLRDFNGDQKLLKEYLIKLKFEYWYALEFEALYLKSDQDSPPVFDLDELDNMIEEKQLYPHLDMKEMMRRQEYRAENKKASDSQLYYWTNLTTSRERFELWFNYFTPYIRCKLWNRLTFSLQSFQFMIDRKKKSKPSPLAVLVHEVEEEQRMRDQAVRGEEQKRAKMRPVSFFPVGKMHKMIGLIG